MENICLYILFHFYLLALSSTITGITLRTLLIGVAGLPLTQPTSKIGWKGGLLTTVFIRHTAHLPRVTCLLGTKHSTDKMQHIKASSMGPVIEYV